VRDKPRRLSEGQCRAAACCVLAVCLQGRTGSGCRTRIVGHLHSRRLARLGRGRSGVGRGKLLGGAGGMDEQHGAQQPLARKADGWPTTSGCRRPRRRGRRPIASEWRGGRGAALRAVCCGALLHASRPHGRLLDDICAQHTDGTWAVVRALALAHASHSTPAAVGCRSAPTPGRASRVLLLLGKSCGLQRPAARLLPGRGSSAAARRRDARASARDVLAWLQRRHRRSGCIWYTSQPRVRDAGTLPVCLSPRLFFRAAGACGPGVTPR
jgi:hypothetical protein